MNTFLYSLKKSAESAFEGSALTTGGTMIAAPQGFAAVGALIGNTIELALEVHAGIHLLPAVLAWSAINCSVLTLNGASIKLQEDNDEQHILSRLRLNIGN